jgi:hypothetical protein
MIFFELNFQALLNKKLFTSKRYLKERGAQRCPIDHDAGTHHMGLLCVATANIFILPGHFTSDLHG